MKPTAYGALVTILLGIMETELAPTIKARDRQVKKHWYGVLIGKRLPSTKPHKMPPKLDFLRRLFGYVLEIDRTVRLLEEVEFYISHAPKFRGGPSKLSFLNYHVECHLHETYILRERIETFLKFLERAYRRDRAINRICRTTKRVRRATKRVLESAVRVRGEHVHVRRMRAPDIERAEFIEDFGSYAPPELRHKFKYQFESAYREARAWRTAQARELNTACKGLVEFMAANVLSIIMRRNLEIFTFPPGLARVQSVPEETQARASNAETAS